MSLHGAKQAHDVLAIIPARGGSKGLPGKNIKKIAGLPLLSWTIDQAKKSRLIDRVIVSTEDPKIKQTAKCFNAEVIDRPVEFASDTSSVMDAIRHSLLVLEKEKYYPKFIIILQPTSPLRTSATIDRAIKVFKKNSAAYDSLVPLFPVEGKIGTVTSGCYRPSYRVGATRRQDMNQLYRECGTIFIVKTELVLKNKNFGKKMFPFVVTDFGEALDIDTLEDFVLAEKLMQRK